MKNRRGAQAWARRVLAWPPLHPMVCRKTSMAYTSQRKFAHMLETSETCATRMDGRRYTSSQSQMNTLVVAEKPSVARDIAIALGASKHGKGFIEGNGYVITWAIGHLVALAQPHEMNPRWKRWDMATLPMVPSAWPLVVGEETREQFDIVKRLLRARTTRDVVCATDAGREGELIFRYVYEAAEASKPVKRLWVSSLTTEAILAGFRALRPGSDFDGLADAARARGRADWLVGMNLSRAYSLAHDDNLSVGRVQTPTLAMIVARDLEIQNFVPEHYAEVSATFAPPEQIARTPNAEYEGRYVRAREGQDAKRPCRLPPDGKEAKQIAERARSGRARILSVKRESKRIPPPQLYDLAEIQRDANRLFGLTAQRTLSVLQNLYERYKLISYPRTDSRYLTENIHQTLPDVVQSIAPRFPGFVAADSGKKALSKRFVLDTKVADHHAIIPTETSPPSSLPLDERKLYDLVCMRLLAAYHDDHVYALTQVMTEIVGTDVCDLYASTGTSVEVVGWKIVERHRTGREPAPVPAQAHTLPGGLTAQDARKVVESKVLPKQTEPKPHFSDATLLTAMETAGRVLDDKELSDAMREKGLGTAATRAATLETLIMREYVMREGKSLRATEKGIGLIERVHPHVKSPAMTGEWEAKLAEIERGKRDLSGFMQEATQYVTEVLAGMGSATSSRAQGIDVPHERGSLRALGGPSAPPQDDTSLDPHPRERDLGALLQKAFRLRAFRPAQEEVCAAVASGHDVLVVMPTGAGKSLCYQLPGLARGGTTLVVSPLIALMEDQVAKLAALGLRVARIHSGRDRAESRAACIAYLAGELDFLFIAPERLRVPGFPEMLGKRKPTLIAIDEAHCISQWGHDFRPDYRMLGERLPLLRPAPIVALTATATPDVQDDIAKQLGLAKAARFIRGFRRTNLAIESVDCSKGARAHVVLEVLSDRANRPAIVYAPSRKETEALAKALGKRMRAVAYHAGMTTEKRDKAQAAFLSGKIDVVVATTAFGMGIDKANVRTVIHAALPATIEGYYQEIGRAGRDGDPARALLLHGYHDRKTHEFFLERDYPDEADLTKVWSKLSAEPTPLEDLRKRTRMSSESFEKAFEKVWVHGGAIMQGDTASRAKGPYAQGFRTRYLEHIKHKRKQLELMLAYASSSSCRMQRLVAHFGDRVDSGSQCGLCDNCSPEHAATVRQLALDAPAKASAKGRAKRRIAAEGETTTRKTRRKRSTMTGRVAKEKGADMLAAIASPLGIALRTFRSVESKRRHVPAFRIFSDRTLSALAEARPTSEQDLLAVSGVGPALVKQFGAELLQIIRSARA